MAENAESKPQPRPRTKKYMLVRHGRMRHIGLFEHTQAEIPKTPTQVVVKTDKGLELGEIVGHLTCYKGGRFRLDGDQVDEYFKTSDIDISCRRAGRFIRFAREDDLSEHHHFQRILREEMATCQRLAGELKLPMKVVEAEHILGGERLVFYFMAEGRVDFRELVRKLSHEFQTRIEMRQIGARDEAKLLGDVESCGQEICCRRYLKYLKPVNMRMAKTQKATLDPAKISGFCGRLKCCLRYEDETYTVLKKRLPKRNMMVRTPKGEGRVVDTQIITQLVMVEYARNDREAVPVDDIQVLGPAPRRPRPDEAGEGATETRRGRGARGDRRGRRPERSGASRDGRRPETGAKPDTVETKGTGGPTKRRRRRGGQGRQRARADAPASRGASSEQTPASSSPASSQPRADAPASGDAGSPTPPVSPPEGGDA